jgi:carbonic anhydrase
MSEDPAVPSVIDELLQNNRRYATTYVSHGLSARPSKAVAVVVCMDARIDVHGALGLRQGDAHVIRNAGGIVSDDVLRSLLISQRLLGTRAVMLVHHTGCGMLDFRDEDLAAAVERDTGARPPFALGAFADLDADVRRSVAAVAACPFLLHRDEVRGFVYDVATAELREVS